MEQSEERPVSIIIDSDISTRKGVWSNFIQVKTSASTATIDFINVDFPGEEGESHALLSSRVYMSIQDMISLRDVLDAHIHNSLNGAA